MELESEVKSLAVQASNFKIANNDQYLTAGELREAIKVLRKKIDESYDPIISKAFAAHKEAVKQKKAQDDPLDRGERDLKQAMIAWTQAQEQQRRLEQARLELAAKRQAEADALELALTLEAAGATEAAAEVLDEPIQPAAVVLPKSTPKLTGFSYRRIYDAKVIDRKAFLAAIIAGQIPDEAWQPNEQFLRQQAGSLKEALKWPGVELTWKDV